MFRILESQAPAKQKAGDTIATLSSRLQSATLLEDRRAAILGLRSFAKLYPASVASGALRNLINSLSLDAEDVDTTKVVLETLLMLFSPDESSPEASDDIALWLADEFTQRQENITVLLDLLERNEFFCRLYSLQLISAISTARPQRTQDCVYTAPLGISRLVAILDDKREALRAEGLLLLTALTPASPELQKLVAFENAFDRVFAIIDNEGSLTNGGVVVQDCLSLLANLLRLNASNQSFFRETGGVPKVAAILAQALKDETSPDTVNEWNASQRDKNLWGFMSIIRLFLLGGSVNTQMNQSTFWQNGVVFQMLEIGFHATLPAPIRAEALHTCADLIRGNTTIQERFSQRDVLFYVDVPPTPSTPAMPNINGQSKSSAPIKVNVIQGLLDLALAVSCSQAFDVRLAACECIKAYLYGHGPIRLHFLQHARDGHAQGKSQPDNVLSILLDEPSSHSTADPFRQWIAAVILFHLLYDNYETKNIAMSIEEGDASQGEEVVTCIQSLTANLVSKAQKGNDDQAVIGYLMVLSGWLYEDPDAVNDFLQEGSSVQALIQLILQPGPPRVLEAGLCAFLLGVIYEFSSKESPIPRSKLHDILTGRLGRDQFNDKMTKLRENSYVRDFEILPQGVDTDGPGGQPTIYFDKTFVDFLKDNFSRVYRAFDRDPNIEVSVTANGVQKGISRELVDSLKAQVDEKSQALQKVESEKITLERKLGQEQVDHRRAKDSAGIELSRIKSINESLQRNHEEELTKVRDEHKVAINNTAQHIETMRKAHEGELAALRADSNRAITETTAQVQQTVANIQAQARKIKEDNEAVAAKVRTRHEAEVEDLKASIVKLERQLEKANRDHDQDLRTAHDEYESERAALEGRWARAEEKAEEAESRARDAKKAVEEKEEARKMVQTELDDLFMVLGDLEDKRARDKKRLKSLGEEVSDAEDDDDGEGEGADEDEE